MEKYLLDTTLRIGNQKKVMTTAQVNDVVGTLVVKLRGMKTKNILYKQLPLNENENNFDEKLNENNYKRTAMRLNDSSQKNSFSLLLMCICLVMGVFCLSILNFLINI